jgi:hypothetical protein
MGKMPRPRYNPGMNITHRILALALPAAALFLTACHTNIEPLKPLQRQEVWVPDDGSAVIELTKPTPVPPPRPAVATVDSPDAPPSAPATTEPTTLPAKIDPVNVPTTDTAAAPSTQTSDAAPATQTADTPPVATQPDAVAATEPAVPAELPPGKKVIKLIDPNQTTRFVYKASYENVWQQALLLISRTGFTLDRRDYRLGVITTQPLPSAQFLEFWKPQHASVTNAMENTVNSQRRLVRLTISPVPGKPDFYQVAVQVLVERESNPSEILGGPIFIEGSGFGRNAMALRSDYAELAAPRWVLMGHDPRLEKKLLDELFKRI